MNIKSLGKMEEIVKKNRSLSWNGWDVVNLIPNPTAWSKPNGAFVRGRWYIRQVFPITENGWTVPDRFVG